MRMSQAASLDALLERVPPLPADTTAMLALDDADDDHFDSLTRLLDSDRAASLWLARLAEVERGRPFHRKGAADALLAVGVRRARSTLFARTAYGLLPGHDSIAGRAIWRHSLTTAAMLRAAAQCEPTLGSPLVAYLVGLVHDVGRLLFPTPQVMDAIEPDLRDHGAAHDAVSAGVARQWGLPRQVAEAIERHHDGPMPALTSLGGLLRHVESLNPFHDSTPDEPTPIGGAMMSLLRNARAQADREYAVLVGIEMIP